MAVKILTTGVLSGLGKHFYETLGGIGWTRKTPFLERQSTKQKGVDILIHCAFNSRREITSNCLYDYFSDNVFLTKELTSIPHQKFILMSTVDLYPRKLDIFSEDVTIDVDDVKGIYGITKLVSESIVREKCKDYLILRLVTPLGAYSRKNNLIRLIEDEDCQLTLAGNSRYNCILHRDISDFVLFAIENNLQGVYNLASSNTITLQEVAEMLGKKVQFGKHYYDVGNIDNRKVSSVFPQFQTTTKVAISRFISDYSKKY